MKVLIVDDDQGSRQYLVTAVEFEGHEVRSASEGRKGWEAFQEFHPDLVISDICMPQMTGLDLLKKIRRRDPNTIVVLMTGYGSEEYALQALRLKADDYLRKPVPYADLLTIIQKYYDEVSGRDIDHRIPGMILRHELTLKIENRTELIPRVAAHLVRETGGAIGHQELLGVRLGLTEILTNAIEHGNLSISYQEKAEALEKGPRDMDRLIEERLEDPEKRNRRVTVEFRQCREFCEWTISDEGDGFNWRAVADPLQDDSVMSLHGRGIFLSRLQFDQFEFLGKGNVVRMRKNVLPRTAKQGEAAGLGRAKTRG